jgi:type II secretory pathway pseudopilin PulG
MNLKSQKGYSLLEIGVGLILVTIFMICGVTMLRGTYNTYRFIDQQNIVMNYLIRAVEKELLESANFEITDSPADTMIQENTNARKVVVTRVDEHNLVITTTVEILPARNGKNYSNSKVKLLTANAEFYTKKEDPSSKRFLTLKTLKIGGKDLGT